MFSDLKNCGGRVSLIIVNWNGRDLLPECLDGLRQQTYRDFQIIMVDNGSEDGSVDFVNHHYPEVRTIALGRNLGFAAGNNIALRTVRTEYAALLNNDAVAHPCWLENLVEGLERYPEAGSAASKMLFYDCPDTIDRAGDAYTRAGAGLLRGRGHPGNGFDRREWVFGACAGAALYRMSMFEDIGLFDEDFFLLYEDIDLSFRGQLKGYKCVYIPEAVVFHKASNSIVDDSHLSVYYGHRNLEWVYIKNMPPGIIVRTMAMHVIYNVAAFLYFAVRGRLRSISRAKLDAVKGIKREMAKRKTIQATTRVRDEYIWGLLERERFLPRFTRRLVKTSGDRSRIQSL